MNRTRIGAVFAAIGSLFALACRADTDLTPRLDVQARAYFAGGVAQTAANASQWASPGHRYVAHSHSTGSAEERITVTDLQRGRVVPIVTIRESDPGSGRSHQISWTADGAALLISGSGALEGRPATLLCLVYRIAEDDLLSAAPCPAATGMRS